MGIGRCPDLSVQVERSPILYSVFHSSSHSGDWDKKRLEAVNDIEMLGQHDFAPTQKAVRWTEGPRFAPAGKLFDELAGAVF